jgi:PAS domain S-box-containing protein
MQTMKLRGLLVFMFLTVSMIPICIIGGSIGFAFASLFLIGVVILVTFIVSLIIAHFISRPLEKLTRNIDEISKGNLDVTLEKSEIYEINRLTTSLDRVMTSLKLAIHKVGVKKGEIFEETMKAKAEAEARYQQLLSVIDDWVWESDDKGVYTACSDKIVKTLGYTPDEVIGKTIFDFIIPEDVKRVKTVFLEVEKNHQPVDKLEMWCTHKDGRHMFIQMSGIPIFSDEKKFVGYRGVIRDITELKTAEDQLEELDKKLNEMKGRVRDVLNEKRKSGLFKKKPWVPPEEKVSREEFDSVFIFDDNANIVDCNEKMYKQLGYTKDEMLALNVTDFDVLQTKDDLKEKIGKIKRRGSINFKTIHKRKDGSAVPVSETMQYLKDQGIYKCVVINES